MRIHHVALRTSDVQRLASFYVGVLGFSELRRTTSGSVWLAAEGAILMLEARGPEEPDVAAGSRELVAFAIEPKMHALYISRLGAAGIAVEASTAHTVYFRDPDGRRIGLSAYPDRLG